MKSRLLWSLAPLASVAAWVAACSSFSAKDGSADGGSPSPGADAALTDGSASVDGGVTTTDAGGPDINGGFEVTGGGCGMGWSATTNAAAHAVGPGQTSAHACRICNSTGTQNTYTVTRMLPGRPGEWTLDAWVRAAPPAVAGGPPPSQAVAFLDPADAPTDAITTVANLSTTTWKPISAKLTATTSSALVLEIGGDGAPDACIDVDDVVVTPPPL